MQNKSYVIKKIKKEITELIKKNVTYEEYIKQPIKTTHQQLIANMLESRANIKWCLQFKNVSTKALPGDIVSYKNAEVLLVEVDSSNPYDFKYSLLYRTKLLEGVGADEIGIIK